MTYHFMSNATGEIVPTLLDVIRTALNDLLHYHIVNLKWSYSHKGF